VQKARCFIFGIVFLLISPCLCWSWQGEVVGVSDGDTITVMHDGKGEKIRLYGVDCPEKDQDFGQKAKQFTSSMVFGKTVDVKPVDQDRYGRTVGIVVYDRVNLNVELIRSGHAWVYRQYCTRPECKAWEFIEAKAKDEKNGLWSVPNPTPPWEFRHNGRSGQANQRSQTPPVDQAQTGVVYHANVSSKVFHGPGCRDYNCKNCTATFKSKDEALKAGYRPHEGCVK
jgi:micrococcal nuclease